ncbi:FMN-dependent NADH-azoreductase [Sphingobium algorifonticola]|uniref:FMN dependent NADH:quinone oxidoreductase n=1 Tax=Sphingobium algorifonticola TaxID=2008318 RepID=A0A437JC60_9SPHN|nr:NAD(P)H-dependent oxidoreductase [Sphingobium algorifonticola]RVT43536.1 NAD(P)H dehydrogenase [Sphingobium algorifonticola]
MRLLHIDASPRDTRSRSRAVADHFLAALAAMRPALVVEPLKLFGHALPTLADGMVEGRYARIMGGTETPDIAEKWAEVQGHVDHFLSFDAYVISTPMWNFGVPYVLKHYVDVLTHPRITFVNDAQGNVTGLANGRKALVIAASAMDFGGAGDANDALAALDFQLRYLETWLRFIGVDPVETIRVAPTFGAPEAVEAAMAAGGASAERIAARF